MIFLQFYIINSVECGNQRQLYSGLYFKLTNIASSHLDKNSHKKKVDFTLKLIVLNILVY